MSKRWFVIFLLTQVLLSNVAWASESNVLRITTHELAYSNLYRPLYIPENAERIVLEYYVRGEDISGYASGGAVHLWWDSGEYIANKLDHVSYSGSGGLRLMTPKRVFVDKEIYPIEEGVWYGLKIELLPREIIFFAKLQEEKEWTELYRTERAPALLSPPDGIIVGVGRHDGSNPYLRNSHIDLRKVGKIYFDEVTLTVDGKVVLYESFEEPIDELKEKWDFATDPANDEPVFEVVPYDESSIILTESVVPFRAELADEAPYYNYPTITLSLDEFYSSLDYEKPELAGVKAAVDKGDYNGAAGELLEYFRAHKGTTQELFGFKPLPTSGVRRIVPGAERLLQREYSYHKAPHTFEGDIDWTYNPTSYGGVEYNKEWTAAFTRFAFLRTLADAYRITGNEEYAREIIYLMKHFITKFPVPRSQSYPSDVPSDIMYLVYNQLSTSIRVGNWARGILAVADSPSLTPDDLVTILKGILEHVRRMEMYPYLGAHNWQMFEVQSLLRLSTILPEFARAEAWSNWAVYRMMNQLAEQVYPDGAQIELCPSYHGGVISSFLEMGELMLKLGKPVPHELNEVLGNMARHLIKISRPDGSLPAFGEVSQSRVSSSVRSSAARVAQFIGDEGDLLWCATSGEKGEAPSYTSTAQNWAGFYTMRTGWDKDALYMVMKAGPYGAAHQNEDKLNFELYAYNELFFVDPGYYIYNANSPWRKYYISSLAHNTVVPDGLTQYRRNESHLWVNKEPNDAIWISEEGYDFVSGKYDSGYGDFMHLFEKHSQQKLYISHQRDVLFIKPELWLIIDWMVPKDEDEHTYDALFQSLLPISLDERGFTVLGQRASLELLPIPSGSLKLEVIQGQLEPIRRGWIYSANKKNEELPTAVVSQRTSGPACQAYFLVPSKRSPRKAQVERISTDGDMIISGRLKVDDLTIEFIAQPESGRRIGTGALETTARIKAIVKGPNRDEVIEITR
jgi:hypothetical protein